MLIDRLESPVATNMIFSRYVKLTFFKFGVTVNFLNIGGLCSY